MNVLMLSAEVAPFVTVGGLSQVNYYLSKSLLKNGNDVRLFTPMHGKIKRKYKLHPYITSAFKVPTDARANGKPKEIECNVKIFKTHKPITYFLENQEYYTLRENVFGYADDHQRFYLLSRGCLEWLLYQMKNKEWVPDVIHAHDWHAGYFIELARKHPRYKKALKNIPILYTVHNFGFQGNYDFINAPPNTKDKGVERLRSIYDPKLQQQNALLRGILNADWVNTVSPSHALEVLTPEYGEGLEKQLLKRRSVLSGIINGLDTTIFDPTKDPLIKQQFSTLTLNKRIENKLDLQREFNLKTDPNIPLLAFSGRLDNKQKGLHLLVAIIEQLISEFDLQFVILGGGDHSIANDFRLLQEKYPTVIGTHLYQDFKLPHKIFAGADIMLIPSIFEPGGIVALEAMHYGCIPVVHSTGGLKDVVHDFNPTTKKGNGFSYVNSQPLSLLIAIVRALEVYKNHSLWKSLITNAMTADFSWDSSMREYVKLYKKVIAIRKRSTSSNPAPAFSP